MYPAALLTNDNHNTSYHRAITAILSGVLYTAVEGRPRHLEE